MTIIVLDLSFNRKPLNFILGNKCTICSFVCYIVTLYCILFVVKSNIVFLASTTILEFFSAIVGTIVSKCVFFLIITNMVFHIELSNI